MALKAIHIPTGKIIEVYKHRERGTYVNAADCTTEYDKKDIKLC